MTGQRDWERRDGQRGRFDGGDQGGANEANRCFAISELRHGTTLFIPHSFNFMNPRVMLAAQLPLPLVSREVGVVVSLVAVPCLLPYVWAGDGCLESCENIGGALLYVFHSSI